MNEPEPKPTPVDPTLRVQLLEAADVLFQEMKGSRLNPETLASNEAYAAKVGEFLGGSPRQGMLFAILVGMALQDEAADWSELATFFDCTPLQALSLRPELEDLVRKGILVSDNARNHVQGLEVFETQTYSIRRSWFDTLTGVEPPKENPPNVERNEKPIMLILERFAEVISQRYFDDLPIAFLFNELQPKLEEIGPEALPALGLDPQLPDIEVTILLLLTFRLVRNAEVITVDDLCEHLFSDLSARIQLKLSLIRQETQLQKLRWVVLQKTKDDTNHELQLTEKGIREAYDTETAGDFIELRPMPTLLFPKDIGERDLLYNDREAVDLETLDKLLSPEHYEKLMSRLSEQQLGRGLSVLLYGKPGTGKTETVYQLARKHNRRLQRVDVGSVKSMWFGESEKNLRQLFDQYRRWMDDFSEVPILLFNEADALFGNRTQPMQGVDRTLNALQNILLDEMERFEGILFATTNQVGHLDRAFDRRFLFKIRLDPPQEKVRRNIWKQRLPKLTDSQSNELARRFQLSGGQIDNIIRRYRLRSAVNTNPLTFEELMQLCSSESLGPVHDGVGFRTEPPAELRDSEVKG